MKSNDLEKIKQYVSSRILDVQSNHSKLFSLIPTSLKNSDGIDEAKKILDAVYKEKINLLEEIYKEIVKIENSK